MTGLVLLAALSLVPVIVGLAAGARVEHTSEAPPDWEKLHVDCLDRWQPPPSTPPWAQARNDQARAAFVDLLTVQGVDLDDPVALHASLAALSLAAHMALEMPFVAGPQLAGHTFALAGRIPRGVDR